MKKGKKKVLRIREDKLLNYSFMIGFLLAIFLIIFTAIFNISEEEYSSHGLIMGILSLILVSAWIIFFIRFIIFQYRINTSMWLIILWYIFFWPWTLLLYIYLYIRNKPYEPRK
jgi:uncharacterized membrane protein